MRLEDRPYLEVKLVINGKVGHRENVDEIEVPFYCYFGHGLTKRLGLVSQNSNCYYLIDMTHQSKKKNDEDDNEDLDELLRDNNIEIRKAKVIIYG